MKIPPDPSILIRMPNWLGDCVMAMPALCHLSRTLPNAKLFLAGREPLRRLFLDQLGIAGFVPAPASGFRSFIRGMLGAKRAIRDAGISAVDAGILFTNSFSTAAWLWSAGARRRIGSNCDGRRFLLTHPIPFDYAENTLHCVRSYLWLATCAEAILQETTAPAPPEADAKVPIPSVHVGDAARCAAGDLIEKSCVNGSYAVIAPASAYGAVKDWSPAHYRALTAKLNNELNLPVIVTGSAAQSTVCDAIAREQKAAVSLAGKTGINEFAGLLADAALFVGGDSGGAHLAGALGRPTVVIFGITNPTRTRPMGKRVHIIGKGEEHDVDLSTAPAREQARAALAAITPDMVMAAVNEAMYGED